MKKRYVIALLMIILGVSGIIYNLLLFKNPKSVFSTETLPIGEIAQFYVDDEENFYIGTDFNNIILCFDSDGNYTYTVSISTKSSDFYFDSERFLHILDNTPGSNTEYILDVKNKKIIKENTYTEDKLEQLYNENRKNIIEGDSFKKGVNTYTYNYQDDSILIKNLKRNEEKTIKLKGISKKIYIPENVCFFTAFLGIAIFAIAAQKRFR